jgi:hypothetical protein
MKQVPFLSGWFQYIYLPWDGIVLLLNFYWRETHECGGSGDADEDT